MSKIHRFGIGQSSGSSGTRKLKRNTGQKCWHPMSTMTSEGRVCTTCRAIIDPPAKPTAAQLAKLSDAELNRRLLSPLVIDGLLDDINASIESDRRHAERLANDDAEIIREWDGGE